MTARGLDPGAKCRRFTPAPIVTEDTQTGQYRIPRLLKAGDRAIRAPGINENDFRLRKLRQDGRQLAADREDVFGLVENRDDDGEVNAHAAVCDRTRR